MSVNTVSSRGVLPQPLLLRKPTRQDAVIRKWTARFNPSSGTSTYNPLDNIRFDLASQSNWCNPSTAVLHMRVKLTSAITQGQAANAAGDLQPSVNLNARMLDDGGLALFNRIKVAIQNLTVEDIHNCNQLVSGLYYWNTSYGHYNSVDGELLKTWKYTNRLGRGIPPLAAAFTPVLGQNLNSIIVQGDYATGNKDSVDMKLGYSWYEQGTQWPIAVQSSADGFDVAVPINHISAFFRQRMWALRNSGTVNIDIKLESALQAIVCRVLNTDTGVPTGYSFLTAGAVQETFTPDYDISHCYITMDMYELNPSVLRTFDSLFADPRGSATYTLNTYSTQLQEKPISVGSDQLNTFVFSKAASNLKTIFIKPMYKDQQNEATGYGVSGCANITTTGYGQTVRIQVNGNYYPESQELSGPNAGGYPALYAHNRKNQGVLGNSVLDLIPTALDISTSKRGKALWCAIFGFDVFKRDAIELDGINTVNTSLIQVDMNQGNSTAVATECLLLAGFEETKFIQMANNIVRVSSS